MQAASIHPKADFNAEDACVTLRKAMRGIGTDERKIIEVLVSHNNDQRQTIKQQYLTMYGKDLESDIKSELSGLFEEVCLNLLKPKYYIEAETCRNAMKGAGTNELLIVEIFCTRKTEELKQIKAIYEKIYNRNLDKDLQNELSGDFERIIRSLANAGRPDENTVDEALAKKDAQDLYDAGPGRFGTDEAEFTRILCSRSYPHLIRVFEEFKKICDGKEILDSIRSETSGDLLLAYETLVKCIINRPAYFAEQLNTCIKGAGTKDERLIRIIVTRSEIDLAEVKVEYNKIYKKNLIDDIKGDTSGDYEKILVKLLEGNRK